MCGRFVAETDAEGLTTFFVIDERAGDELPPRWNVAPTDPVHAVVEHAEQRTLVVFRWGLVPQWADDPKVGSRMINARAESVADRPAYRSALERRRCLIPADGYYEWRTQPGGLKVPYLVHDPDRRPLAFAGLWSVWRDPARPEAEPLRSCTIITTRARGPSSELHDRMPVVLPRDAWDAWLDRDNGARQAALDLLRTGIAPAAVHRVSTAVNHVANDGPELISAIEGDELAIG